MINLAIVGLYNRGQQDEYVEMEAASSCSLSRFTLIRRVENEEVMGEQCSFRCESSGSYFETRTQDVEEAVRKRNDSAQMMRHVKINLKNSQNIGRVEYYRSKL